MEESRKRLPLIVSFGVSAMLHLGAVALCVSVWSMRADGGVKPLERLTGGQEVESSNRLSSKRSALEHLWPTREVEKSDDESATPESDAPDAVSPSTPAPAKLLKPDPASPEQPRLAPTPPRPKPRPASSPAKTQEIKLGSDRGSKTVHMAWIGYEDFRKLQGIPGQVEQAGLQMKADPVAGAPMEMDPTPAAPAPGGGGTPAQASGRTSAKSAAAPAPAPAPSPVPGPLARGGTPNDLNPASRQVATAGGECAEARGSRNSD
ncbi:MAG: hypothetical protein NTW19_11415 [Planctomycetota bacterium]|nr:hypothetical protein [Planctomycetota bacterium]